MFYLNLPQEVYGIQMELPNLNKIIQTPWGTIGQLCKEVWLLGRGMGCVYQHTWSWDWRL